METKKGSKRAVGALIFLFLLLSFTNPSGETFRTTATAQDLRRNTAISLARTACENQNVTHKGDLIISDNETLTIENSEFRMNGTISVKDTAMLSIVNSRFTTIPSSYTDGDSIVLNDHTNLIIKNSTVIFNRPSGFDCEIQVRDHAKANVTSSTFRNRGLFVTFNNSEIYVTNSTITISTSVSTYPTSGVATFGNSTAVVNNSTIDGVYIWDTSSISLNNSVIGIVRTTATVNIENSKIDYIETWGGAPTFRIENSTVRTARFGDASARFTDSSVSKISASGDATVWLISCAYGSIETHDNATVFVGWHLPLFGLVSMPYTWVPIINLILVVAIVGIVITALVFFVSKKRAAHSERRTLDQKEPL